MKLADLYEPGDELSRGEADKARLRELVRGKSFKSMIKALSTKKNNPREDNAPDIVGDGGRDESPYDDKATGLV